LGGFSVDKNSKIFVAGHRGLVGSSIVRALISKGYGNVVYKSSVELDLRDTVAVMDFFKKERPYYVFLAAARVGGILANSTYPAQFIYDNLMIQTNTIHAAYLYPVKKLLFLGSSCIYPKYAPQPMREEHLLTGSLEPTNESYAVAKITGIKMCQAYNTQHGTPFISVMPTNLYGPNDNFNLETSHVLPALIRKFHEARENDHQTVTVWGSGTPRREFLHVDDLADACLFLMDKYNWNEHINIGTGEDIQISELAELIGKVIGYQGDIIYDKTKPDGTPRKLLEVSRVKSLGWRPQISLEEGIKNTYAWYVENIHRFRG